MEIGQHIERTDRVGRKGAGFSLRAEDVFYRLLDECVTGGRVRVVTDTSDRVLGDPSSEHGKRSAAVGIRVSNPRFFSAVLSHGNLGLGESFMDRYFEMEEGELSDLLRILIRARIDGKLEHRFPLLLTLGALRVAHVFQGKKRNIFAHYDNREELFDSFLDSTMTYSCGYARSPDDDLEALQENKRVRICEKLRLEPGSRLLDIGCGYGSMLIHAAKHYGASGLGVTLGEDHYKRGNEAIQRAGLAGRVRIELMDFAKVRGRFDRVVSVGMFEHVPRPEYGQFFGTISDVLTDDGIALVHAISCNTRENKHDPFTQKYIFPGSNQPKLSEISHHIEQRKMAILDVENIVRHYALTCSRWLERFSDSRDALARKGYDDRTLRMWEYYLSCGIAAALESDSAVFQVLFAKDPGTFMPLKRV